MKLQHLHLQGFYTNSENIYFGQKMFLFPPPLQIPEFDQGINLDENIFLLTSHEMAQLRHIIMHTMLP